jgi:formate--tetrahydrofolate ligase
MRPIQDVASDLGFEGADVQPWGPDVLKIRPEVAFRDDPLRARLILVSAISPTPAGEGKTTCTVGLTQAARRLGISVACALREPSLGPVFGQKGGGTGGGQSRLEPSARINLHFTGDLHAVTAAHNLLAALADNHMYFRSPAASTSQLDQRQVTFRRVLDMNDRFLRRTVIGLGGKAMGVPREDGFDITAASEVMAILCLSHDYADLKARLGRILLGFTEDGAPVYAGDIGAAGAMAALLRDALLPNLVQTTEGAPAFVHGGPFGNIAHGCNSLAATRLAMRRADYVFTEAGFGFDLGAEKFLDIKCRAAGIWPHAVVLVATLRALKVHGGAPVAESGFENARALALGMENLEKHIDSVRQFGLDPVVALNVRAGDTTAELDDVVKRLRDAGVHAGLADVFAQGGAGATALVETIVARAKAASPSARYIYDLADPPAEKIRKVARTIYGADDVDFTITAKSQLDRAVKMGFGEVPICMAKTHLSLSDDQKRVGRPRDFDLTVREVRIAAGAGFLVPLTGEVLTMPGLPRRPHALDIDLTAAGDIQGVE